MGIETVIRTIHHGLARFRRAEVNPEGDFGMVDGSKIADLRAQISRETHILTAHDLMRTNWIDSIIADSPEKRRRYFEEHASWLLSENYNMGKKILASLENNGNSSEENKV